MCTLLLLRLVHKKDYAYNISKGYANQIVFRFVKKETMQNYQGNSKAWSSLFIWKTHTVRHRTMMLEFAKLTKSKKCGI
jgi:hypothetical protein